MLYNAHTLEVFAAEIAQCLRVDGTHTAKVGLLKSLVCVAVIGRQLLDLKLCVLQLLTQVFDRALVVVDQRADRLFQLLSVGLLLRLLLLCACTLAPVVEQGSFRIPTQLQYQRTGKSSD